MLPLRDDLPTRRRAWVNYLLIAANVAVFLWLIGQSEREQARVIGEFGTVPARLLAHPSLGQWATLVTSMFLHSGWIHIGGNMLVLWIFGNNVEDRLGPIRYLVFYAAVGIVAGLMQVAVGPRSDVPAIGASGAIAGVLAAYLLWYPRARVVVLIPILILPWLVRLPAFIVIGLWFVLQVMQGVGALGEIAGSGGIAWWAHIGGFVAGLVLAPLMAPPRRRFA